MSGLDFSMACSGEYAYGDGIDIISPQDGGSGGIPYAGSALQKKHKIEQVKRDEQAEAAVEDILRNNHKNKQAGQTARVSEGISTNVLTVKPRASGNSGAHTGTTLQQKREGHTVICACKGKLKDDFSEGISLGYLPVEDARIVCEPERDPIELGR
ncbi:MAG: hypothetical protein H6860_01770 [Rhodospirillales bacterium]|nr:hypothetical protein [Alphaproteobacteria bacterium]MCB9981108.1 hypothetical protein [Rhodospirillales bacterium]